MTPHYTFVEAEAHRAAADVAALIEGQGSDPAPTCCPVFPGRVLAAVSQLTVTVPP